MKTASAVGGQCAPQPLLLDITGLKPLSWSISFTELQSCLGSSKRIGWVNGILPVNPNRVRTAALVTFLKEHWEISVCLGADFEGVHETFELLVVQAECGSGLFSS